MRCDVRLRDAMVSGIKTNGTPFFEEVFLQVVLEAAVARLAPCFMASLQPLVARCWFRVAPPDHLWRQRLYVAKYRTPKKIRNVQ